MADIVDYNGFHIDLGSPVAARLRKQDAAFREALDDGTLTVIGSDTDAEGGEESTDYSKLKKDGLIALLDERGIDHSEATNNPERIALLEASDTDTDAEGGELS